MPWWRKGPGPGKKALACSTGTSGRDVTEAALVGGKGDQENRFSPAVSRSSGATSSQSPVEERTAHRVDVATYVVWAS